MGFLEWLLGEEPSIFERFAHAYDKGHYGEYLTSYALSNDNISGYSKVLCNIYIPYRGKLSEIDILFIHEKGMYVIESKNYSGWIFGSADGTKWTQCLNRNTKNTFYNPLMQNKTHINAIKQFLRDEKVIVKSYIVFSDRCEFKKIPENTSDYTILHRNRMLSILREDIRNKDVCYTKEEIDRIYDKLKPCTEISKEEKQQHINRIKQNYKK